MPQDNETETSERHDRSSEREGTKQGASGLPRGALLLGLGGLLLIGAVALFSAQGAEDSPAWVASEEVRPLRQNEGTGSAGSFDGAEETELPETVEPAAASEAEPADSADPTAALGALMGDSLGRDLDTAGVGLRGTGRGGGGEGRVDFGTLSGVGHGAGAGSGGSSSRRARRPLPTAPAGAPTTTASAARPQRLPQSGVLASTFVGGQGASARLEDLLERGVMVNGQNVRLQAFDELGRLPYPVPAEEAVGLHAELERGRILRDGERVHLQIALMARRGEAPPRPRMDVRLILDRSGSMTGEKWAQAVAAAEALIGRLQPNDTFGLISYSDGATVDLAPRRVGDGSAALRALRGLSPGGGTNIEDALRTAGAHAPSRRDLSDVLLNVLISDGVASLGQTNAHELSQMAREIFDRSGTLTTTIGLGTEFDEDTMLGIAREGSGSYHFVRRASDVSEILTDELEERAQAVAQALRLRIELGEGVVARRVYGSRLLSESEHQRVRATEVATDRRLARELGISRTRQREEERGLRVHLPSFRRGDQHVVLMELEVPPGTAASRIAHITLDYKDLFSRQNRTTAVDVRAERTADPEASVASTQRSVKRTVLAFQAGDALQGAASHLESGDLSRARDLLRERRELLTAAAEYWHDRALSRDANLLSRYEQVLTSAWPGWDQGSRRTLLMAMSFYGDRRMR